MMTVPTGTTIWVAAGVTDMRRGFTGLSAAVQTVLEENPFGGQVFVFRGKRGDLVKVLWWDGDGLCLFAFQPMVKCVHGVLIWKRSKSACANSARTSRVI
jgi:transposase